jgi:hypothetical protein
MGCQVALMVPKIAAQVPAQNQQQVLAAIAALQDNIARMEANIDILRNVNYNQTATTPEDAVIPPKSTAGALAPAEFPRTAGQVLALEEPLLTQVEDFYNLNHVGTLESRRKTVRRYYGIGVIIS